MTALLVLERGSLDELVVVSRQATRETGARMGLQVGESLRVRDLLAATVVRSANDACRALADHISPHFVVLMNRRAAELGMRDTRFLDPCGHDRPGQYSSAADLALLAEYVMRNADYARLAIMPSVRVATTAGRKFDLRNTNALIGRYDGTLGVKTGFTSGAGHCLVAIAERDGMRVMVVLLNSPNRWWNAVGLFERAFKAQPS